MTNEIAYARLARSEASPGVAVAVTVILPVFNCGSRLAECFDALDQMSLTGYQVIVIDDGSTDETRQIVLDRVQAMDTYLVLGATSNGGVARARNAAIKEAVGEYIWFVDWDDIWAADIVDRLLATARSADADVVVCRATRNHSPTSGGPVIDGLAHEEVLSGAAAFDQVLTGGIRGYLWSKLIRRSRIGGDPFPAKTSLSDFAGLVPILAACERVAMVPDILYKHLVRTGSLTNTQAPNLDDLYASGDVVREVAAGLPTDRQREAAVRYFNLRFVHLGVVNTALRLGSSSTEYEDAVRRLREVARWSDLRDAARRHPVSAARILLIKTMGRQYRVVYRAYTGLRARVRRTL